MLVGFFVDIEASYKSHDHCIIRKSNQSWIEHRWEYVIIINDMKQIAIYTEGYASRLNWIGQCMRCIPSFDIWNCTEGLHYFP